MSEEEGSSFKFHGITGAHNVFAFPHCETDRFWRKSLSLTPERYFKYDQVSFDECKNAFIKPKKPVYLDVLEHLHKRADFE
jgi:hypothetical protein